MAYATAFADTARAEHADLARAKTLINSLNAADRTYDDLGPHLKRALGYERRPMFRQPRLVRAETERALRHARRLVAHLEAAHTAQTEQQEAFDGLPTEHQG